MNTVKRIVDRMREGYALRHATPPGMPSSGFPPGVTRFVLPEHFFGTPPAPKEEVETGIEITGGSATTPIQQEERAAASGIRMVYNLIPRDGPAMAYAHISWDSEAQQLLYRVVEPTLAPEDRRVMELVRKDLEVRLDMDFTRLGVVKAKEFLRQEIEKSFEAVGRSDKQTRIILTPAKRTAIIYHLENEMSGVGRIEPLLQDPNIEDISCDGLGIPVYVYHRDPRIGSVRTTVIFENAEELDSFAVKLAQKCKKEISIAEPLLDGALPDGSRVQATLGTDIARRGSNFTIRKFTELPLTPTHMLMFNTADSTMLAYLWMAIENGMSILISGGSATGKTSLLNAISLFIRPTMKVVSIEDTSELRLPHSHWIPEVARTPIATKTAVGDVTMFDLLRSSLRQRPDYIIVGEVRGEEAYVLFQQIATGHAGMATIHAANFPQLIDRLITPPIALPPTLLENIDVVLFLALSRKGGQYIRRTAMTTEIVGMEGKRPIINNVFSWDPVTDAYTVNGKSLVMKKIGKKLGLTENTIRDEITRRKRVLEWMKERKLTDYRQVAKVINAYYMNRERLMDKVMAG